MTRYALFHPITGRLMLLFETMTMANLYGIVNDIEVKPEPVEYKPHNFYHRCAAAAGEGWVEYITNTQITGMGRLFHE